MYLLDFSLPRPTGFSQMQKPYIYMVFATEGLFEVAIESWPEGDLNP